MTSGNLQKNKKNKNKKYKDPHETLTLKYWLGGVVVVVLIIAIIFVTQFVGEYLSKVKLVEGENSTLVDKKNDLIYYPLTGSFEARYTRVDSYYGLLDKQKFYQLAYYDDDGSLYVDGKLWLTESENDGGTVYYTGKEPTLEDFSWQTVYICSDDYDSESVALASLTGDEADTLINSYLQGERYVGNGYPYETYKLRVSSKKYDWLYYVMYLVRCDNGDYYVYGVNNRAGISVDKKLFTDKLGGAIES